MPRQFPLPSSEFTLLILLSAVILSLSTCEQVNDDLKNVNERSNGREKRDGGIISGPLIAAVVSGIVGMTVEAASGEPPMTPRSSSGGCLWFGSSPLCNSDCPTDYDEIRRHSGRCSGSLIAGFCYPDSSFGKPCLFNIGSTFQKRFCCK